MNSADLNIGDLADLALVFTALDDDPVANLHIAPPVLFTSLRKKLREPLLSFHSVQMVVLEDGPHLFCLKHLEHGATETEAARTILTVLVDPVVDRAKKVVFLGLAV